MFDMTSPHECVAGVFKYFADLAEYLWDVVMRPGNAIGRSCLWMRLNAPYVFVERELMTNCPTTLSGVKSITNGEWLINTTMTIN